jgi:xanthine dehydrogenase YagS FAD-binding subunit
MMNDFSYQRAQEVSDVPAYLKQNKNNRIIGGGTNLLDLMKEGVMYAHGLIDVNTLSLKEIAPTPTGGLLIGATVTNSDLAYNKEIENRYPLLSKAILKGASPQLRNMATAAGNLMQRTRCYYFYDTSTPCNKRVPGSGCSALNGINHIHAILGANENCIAVHPSDMCVALAALEATVHIQSESQKMRTVPFAAFHKLPEDTPHIDNVLAHDEIITGIELPKKGFAKHHAYVKARERNSYAFALSSAAVGYELQDSYLSEVRIALGGVAHKPWRNLEAEAFLKGKLPTKDNFQATAELILKDAVGRGKNNYKIELSKRVIVRALEMAINNEVQ